MISTYKAKEKDYQWIVDIGTVSVPEAHEGSCVREDLKEYTTTNYKETAIKKELLDQNNIYHLLTYHDKAVGVYFL